MIRIGLDGMGGDHAPAETVKGAVEAVKSAGRPGVLLLVRTPRGNSPIVLPLQDKN